jgi:hypothetical protein
MPRQAKSSPGNSTANIGFEAKLWLTADKLRNNMDAAEYKHVVLGGGMTALSCLFPALSPAYWGRLGLIWPMPLIVCGLNWRAYSGQFRLIRGERLSLDG